MFPVVVRHYSNDYAFAQDAAEATRAGYRVVARSRESAGLSGAGAFWALVALLLTVLGFMAPILWIGAIVFGLLAMTGRSHVLVVTYQLGYPPPAAAFPTW